MVLVIGLSIHMPVPFNIDVALVIAFAIILLVVVIDVPRGFTIAHHVDVTILVDIVFRGGGLGVEISVRAGDTSTFKEGGTPLPGYPSQRHPRLFFFLLLFIFRVLGRGGRGRFTRGSGGGGCRSFIDQGTIRWRYRRIGSGLGGSGRDSNPRRGFDSGSSAWGESRNLRTGRNNGQCRLDSDGGFIVLGGIEGPVHLGQGLGLSGGRGRFEWRRVVFFLVLKVVGVVWGMPL
jgi:hypothetical protein